MRVNPPRDAVAAAAAAAPMCRCWPAGPRRSPQGCTTRAPPEFRGAGCASAVSAELGLQAREAGAAEALLYTGPDNPESNSIYQRTGYRPVDDRVAPTFTVPGATDR